MARESPTLSQSFFQADNDILAFGRCQRGRNRLRIDFGKIGTGTQASRTLIRAHAVAKTGQVCTTHRQRLADILAVTRKVGQIPLRLLVPALLHQEHSSLVVGFVVGGIKPQQLFI